MATICGLLLALGCNSPSLEECRDRNEARIEHYLNHKNRISIELCTEMGTRVATVDYVNTDQDPGNVEQYVERYSTNQIVRNILVKGSEPAIDPNDHLGRQEIVSREQMAKHDKEYGQLRNILAKYK